MRIFVFFEVFICFEALSFWKKSNRNGNVDLKGLEVSQVRKIILKKNWSYNISKYNETFSGGNSG